MNSSVPAQSIPFSTWGEPDAPPAGAIDIEADGKGMFFCCPCGCAAESYLHFRHATQQRPSWEWDGNRERPTLSPSVRRLDCGWHGWLRAGVWVEA